MDTCEQYRPITNIFQGFTARVGLNVYFNFVVTSGFSPGEFPNLPNSSRSCQAFMFVNCFSYQMSLENMSSALNNHVCYYVGQIGCSLG